MILNLVFSLTAMSIVCILSRFSSTRGHRTLKSQFMFTIQLKTERYKVTNGSIDAHKEMIDLYSVCFFYILHRS